jgi:hypothetical protein
VGLPGLLVAAVAERERVTVIHYHGDYDLIAHVTGQPSNGSSPGALSHERARGSHRSGAADARCACGQAPAPHGSSLNRRNGNRLSCYSSPDHRLPYSGNVSLSLIHYGRAWASCCRGI